MGKIVFPRLSGAKESGVQPAIARAPGRNSRLLKILEPNVPTRGEITERRETKKIFSTEQKLQKIQTLGAGDILGWSWLLPPYVWHFAARAAVNSKVIALNAKYLRAKCEEDKDLGYEVLKRLAGFILQRLDAARRKLIEAEIEI